MALAETAKLVAELELKDKLSGSARSAEGALGSLERRIGSLGKSNGFLQRSLSTGFGVGLERLAEKGIRSIFGAIDAGEASLQKLELVGGATEQVIKSTGAAAGVSAVQVRNLAEKYEGLNAVIDDKVIQSGENLLLTFTSIRKDAFEPTLQAALDMNQALGGGEGGLQGTIIQVGKALQDPIRGLTSLRKVGVSFSKDQEDQIKKLVKANDLYGAQKIVLAELAKEFGGQFKRAGESAAATQARLKDSVEDLQTSLARGLEPALTSIRGKLADFLSRDDVKQRIEDVGRSIGDLATRIGDFVSDPAVGRNAGQVFDFLLERAKAAASFVTGTVIPAIQGIGAAGKTAWDAIPEGIRDLLVKGVIADRVVKFTFGISPLEVAGSIIGDTLSPILHNFLGRGSSPANPLFVTGPGIGGAVAGGGGGGVTPLGLLGLGAFAITVGVAAANAVNDQLVKQEGNQLTENTRKFLTENTLSTEQIRNALTGFDSDIAKQIADENKLKPQERLFQDNIAGVKDDAAAARALLVAALAMRAAAEVAPMTAAEKARDDRESARILQQSGGSLGTAADALIAAAAKWDQRPAWLSAEAERGKQSRVPFVATHATAAGLAEADHIVEGFQNMRGPWYNVAVNQNRTIEALKAQEAAFIATGDVKSATHVGNLISTMQGILNGTLGTANTTLDAIKGKVGDVVTAIDGLKGALPSNLQDRSNGGLGNGIPGSGPGSDPAPPRREDRITPTVPEVTDRGDPGSRSGATAAAVADVASFVGSVTRLALSGAEAAIAAVKPQPGPHPATGQIPKVPNIGAGSQDWAWDPVLHAWIVDMHRRRDAGISLVRPFPKGTIPASAGHAEDGTIGPASRIAQGVVDGIRALVGGERGDVGSRSGAAAAPPVVKQTLNLQLTVASSIASVTRATIVSDRVGRQVVLS